MAIYRYTPAGIERLSRRALVRTLVLLPAIVAVSLYVNWNPASAVVTIVPTAILIGVYGVVIWKHMQKMQGILAATEIEVDPFAIEGRAMGLTNRIPWQDISALRIGPDRIEIRGTSTLRTLELISDLENFGQLRDDVELYTHARRSACRPVDSHGPPSPLSLAC